jgi:hypothetical protein
MLHSHKKSNSLSYGGVPLMKKEPSFLRRGCRVGLPGSELKNIMESGLLQAVFFRYTRIRKKPPECDMKMVKIAACFVVFLRISVFFVYGETVLLYSKSPEGVEDGAYSIFYMEDGIMDVFFQAGHIIFNGSSKGGGTNGAAGLPEELPFKDRPSLRMAKSGGASLVLEVCLHFSGRAEETLPESAEYLLIDVRSERSLAGGTVSLAQARGSEKLEDFELVRKMGREVGLGALGGM